MKAGAAVSPRRPLSEFQQGLDLLLAGEGVKVMLVAEE